MDLKVFFDYLADDVAQISAQPRTKKIMRAIAGDYYTYQLQNGDRALVDYIFSSRSKAVNALAIAYSNEWFDNADTIRYRAIIFIAGQMIHYFDL